MSIVELPPPSDPETAAKLRAQVRFKFQKGNLLMAMNEEDSTKWELVRVFRRFTYWLLDEYTAVYHVSYANGRTRMCIESELEYLGPLLDREDLDEADQEHIPAPKNFKEDRNRK